MKGTLNFLSISFFLFFFLFLSFFSHSTWSQSNSRAKSQVDPVIRKSIFRRLEDIPLTMGKKNPRNLKEILKIVSPQVAILKTIFEEQEKEKEKDDLYCKAHPFDKIVEIRNKTRRNKIRVTTEDYLKNQSEIIKCKKMPGADASVTFLFTYKNGTRGVYKPFNPDLEDYSYYQNEIASYELAKFLEIPRVPPTVEVSLDLKGNSGRWENCKELNIILQKHHDYLSNTLKQASPHPMSLPGSIQLFVPDSVDALKLYGLDHFQKNLKPQELKFFDFLIGNCDRLGSKNLMLRKGKKVSYVYIDQSMAFLPLSDLLKIRSDWQFMTYCNHMIMALQNPQDYKNLCPFLPDFAADLDRGNYHAYLLEEDLTDSILEEMFGHLLSRKRIDELKSRRDGLIQAIKKCPRI